MEIEWTWNFLESVGAILIGIGALLALLRLIGFLWLWIRFKRG